MADNYSDTQDLRDTFAEVVSQLCLEQPLKTPFLAAVLLIINSMQSQILEDVLGLVSSRMEQKITSGDWRDVKCYLKLLACIQSCLDGDGIFPLLEDLFNRAGELQATNSDDVGCHSSTQPVADPVRVDCLLTRNNL